MKSWSIYNQSKNSCEAIVKNYLNEDSLTFNCEDPTQQEQDIYDELESIPNENLIDNQGYYQKGRVQMNKNQNFDNSQQYHYDIFSSHNLDSCDIEGCYSSGSSAYSPQSGASSASGFSSISQEQPSQQIPLNQLKVETQHSQASEIYQSDSQTQEDSTQSSKLTINQLGQKSCEETKNLFILTIPFIITRLKGNSKEKCRWEYASQITGLKKKMNTLQKFNQILLEIEQKSEENPDILKTFRESIVEILEHDFIKYATNQKDYKTQAILLKYYQSIKLIALSKSFTFSSVKYVKKILKNKTSESSNKLEIQLTNN
ncbi:hypothetical protein ABPG74_013003 [Tetrahymena malaccensis]